MHVLEVVGGGSVPWTRHTTIGTAQISHSAIQQTSSSWNHSVIRAASQRSQSSRRAALGGRLAHSSSAFRSSATNVVRAVGAAAVEQRARSSALPDDDAVGRGRGLDRLLRRRDADAEQHGRSVTALQSPAHLAPPAPRAASRSPVTPMQRDAVDEAARPLADRCEPLVGRRRRGEQHGLDARGVGRVAPAVELVEREVGDDRAVDAGVGERRGEPLVPGVVHGVVVRHHDERDVDVERRGLGDDPRRRRAELERALRRLLDRRPVHHRIGERDADLDRVGAGVGDRAHDVEPLVAEPAGDVGHEQLAPRVAAGAQVRLEVHGDASRRESLGDLRRVLVAPARERDEHRRRRCGTA